MLGVTGALTAENGTGIPWFNAAALCTPDDCTAVRGQVPGAVARSRLEGSGYPSFWNVLIIEIVLVGAAEAYRTGVADPVSTNSPSVTSRVAASTRRLRRFGDLKSSRSRSSALPSLHVRVVGLHHASARHPRRPDRQLAIPRCGPGSLQRLTQRGQGFGFY